MLRGSACHVFSPSHCTLRTSTPYSTPHAPLFRPLFVQTGPPPLHSNDESIVSANSPMRVASALHRPRVCCSIGHASAAPSTTRLLL
eukprot:3049782-Pleurochrysis_carterae.AAC.1